MGYSYSLARGIPAIFGPESTTRQPGLISETEPECVTDYDTNYLGAIRIGAKKVKEKNDVEGCRSFCRTEKAELFAVYLYHCYCKNYTTKDIVKKEMNRFISGNTFCSGE